MVVDPCVNKQKTNFLALTNPACTNMHGMSTVIFPYYLLHVSSSLFPSCLPLCFFFEKEREGLNYHSSYHSFLLQQYPSENNYTDSTDSNRTRL